MAEPVRNLRDVLDRAKAKQQVTSFNKLAKIGRDAGFGVSHTTLASISRGNYPSRPSKETINALVFLSGCGFEEVHRAAGLGEPGVPFTVPDGAERLNVKQREVVNTVIRALLDLQDARDSGTAEQSNDVHEPVNEPDGPVVFLTPEDDVEPDELNPSG